MESEVSGMVKTSLYVLKIKYGSCVIKKKNFLLKKISNSYKSRENNILRPYVPTTSFNQLSTFGTYLVSSVHIPTSPSILNYIPKIILIDL